jgi:hypothetical protein
VIGERLSLIQHSALPAALQLPTNQPVVIALLGDSFIA